MRLTEPTCAPAAAYSVTSYLQPASKALRLTRLSPSAFSASGSPIRIEMDVASTSARKKRKAGASDGAPARKTSKKAAAPVLETDDESDEAETNLAGGFLADAFDEDDEDPQEVEAWLQAQEPSSEPDADGWSQVKTATKRRVSGTQAEVLEID